MTPFDNAPFGKNKTWLSKVCNSVVNIIIFLTIPILPSAVTIVSPTLNGLNNNITIPPATFCNVPDNAIPIANDAAPSTATIEVIWTPSVAKIIITTNTFKVMLKKDWAKEAKDGSTSCFCIPKLIDATIFFTTQKPITHIAIAAISFIPKAATACPKLVIKDSRVISIYFSFCFSVQNLSKKYI